MKILNEWFKFIGVVCFVTGGFGFIPWRFATGRKDAIQKVNTNSVYSCNLLLYSGTIEEQGTFEGKHVKVSLQAKKNQQIQPTLNAMYGVDVDCNVMFESIAVQRKAGVGFLTVKFIPGSYLVDYTDEDIRKYKKSPESLNPTDEEISLALALLYEARSLFYNSNFLISTVTNQVKKK